MDITLDQARAYEAVARLGTIQKAANEIHRTHSAVLYSIKNLEEQTGIKLFDRGGYRNRITLGGELVLKYCRKLLETRQELLNACSKIKDGWEPSLKLIYDDVVDFNFIGRALFHLNEMQAPIEVKILSAHLHEVESLFLTEKADMMVTVLPFQKLDLPSRRLAPIQMYLVAHHQHALNQKHRGRVSNEQLNRHTFITNRTTPGQVGLSTDKIHFDSYFYVNGFVNKKLAIMNKLGFGWLPDYLIAPELKKDTLKILKTEIDNSIRLHPRLFFRHEENLGKASRRLLQHI